MNFESSEITLQIANAAKDFSQGILSHSALELLKARKADELISTTILRTNVQTTRRARPKHT